MNPILLAVLIVSVIGLIAGLGLAVASIVMAVPVDKKAEAIRECLPGANCGACGFSGCDGYASALSKGITTNTALCAPGGNDTSKAIAEVTGLSAGEVAPSAAVVMCQGFCGKAEIKMQYNGVESCQMAKQLFGVIKAYNGAEGRGDNSLNSKMLNRVNRSAVAYNTRVMIQQPSAIVRAAMFLNPSDLT